MIAFAVVSSLLFLVLDLVTIGVNAQKELAFEHRQNPPLGKTTMRTPETVTEGGDDDDSTKNTDSYSSAGGGEWTFATPASKGLSQSSLEVRSFFLYLSLLESSSEREPRLDLEEGRGTFVILFFLSLSRLNASSG